MSLKKFARGQSIFRQMVFLGAGGAAHVTGRNCFASLQSGAISKKTPHVSLRLGPTAGAVLFRQDSDSALSQIRGYRRTSTGPD